MSGLLTSCPTFQCLQMIQIDTPFASYAHPSIVRDNANVHEIGSHTPVVADRYRGISLSSEFDIAAAGRKKLGYFIPEKTPFKV